MQNAYFEKKTVNALTKGSFFRRLRNGRPSGDFLTKQSYCRSSKRFECHYEGDISKNIYLKPDTEIAVGETY